MGLLNFLFGFMAGSAVSNAKRTNHPVQRNTYHNDYYGGYHDDVDCNCDSNYGHDDYDNHNSYDYCEHDNGYGCDCDDCYDEY